MILDSLSLPVTTMPWYTEIIEVKLTTVAKRSYCCDYMVGGNEWWGPKMGRLDGVAYLQNSVMECKTSYY